LEIRTEGRSEMPLERVFDVGHHCFSVHMGELEDWYGWRPTIWSVMHSETISNGFPVAYSVVVKHGGEQGFFHPWLDSVNWLILCVTLAAVSKLYHRRQVAAQRPAGAER